MTSIIKIYKKLSESTLENIVINKSISLKKIKEYSFKSYTLNNLSFDGKIVKKVITDSNKIIDNYIIIYQTITELSIDNWPNIDKYDNVIDVNIIVYEKGISFITETSKYGNISHVQIEGNMVSPVFIFSLFS